MDPGRAGTAAVSGPCKHGLESGCADCGQGKVRTGLHVGCHLPFHAIGCPDHAEDGKPPAYDFGALYETADEGAMPVIEARFHGTCPLCGLRWEPGDEIARSADEDAWAHAGCAAAERE